MQARTKNVNNTLSEREHVLSRTDVCKGAQISAFNQFQSCKRFMLAQVK